MANTTVKGTIAICTSCGAPNRIADGKPLSAGKCGKCSKPLATQKPVEVDGAMLERLIARDTGAFVLDVWAPWCGPCRMMAPEFSKAATELNGQARLVKLNTEQHQAAGHTYGIRGIPTMAAFAGGRERARQSGAMPAASIVNWVRGAI